MPTRERHPKEYVVETLDAAWNSVADLCSELTPEDWDLPTDCPGWSVRDNISHIIGTEKMLNGESPPEVGEEIEIGNPSHVKNEIAKINEAWITTLKGLSGDEMIQELKDITKKRINALKSMTQEDFDAEAMTPAGKADYQRFMQIRTLDTWLHEQDVRIAVDKPGHHSGNVVDLTMDEIELALGFVAKKKAEAPDGSCIKFELTGTVARNMFISIEDGRGGPVYDFDGEPTTVISLDAFLFTRLVGGRTDTKAALESGDVAITGDTALGEKIVRNMNYMI